MAKSICLNRDATNATSTTAMMTSANSHDIQVLNGLIQSVIDSADGYAEAAAGTGSPDHAAFFALGAGVLGL